MVPAACNRVAENLSGSLNFIKQAGVRCARKLHQFLE